MCAAAGTDEFVRLWERFWIRAPDLDFASESETDVVEIRRDGKESLERYYMKFGSRKPGSVGRQAWSRHALYGRKAWLPKRGLRRLYKAWQAVGTEQEREVQGWVCGRPSRPGD